MKKILFTLLTTLLLITNVCFANIKIHALNVGQGDAFLVQTDQQNVLIDTSDVDERSKLERELFKLGVFTLDKVILTHPHADHIGNAAHLVNSGVFKVRAVFDNGVVSTSKLFANYIDTCKRLNVPVHHVSAGDSLDFGDGCRFIVYHPNKELIDLINNKVTKSNPNNESIVGILSYKNFSMLFTGDAESFAEQQFLHNLPKVNILKAGHHGSKTSSSAPFLEKISPQAVIISAGEPTTKRGGNTYGHPHPQALQRFIFANVPKKNIFWTFKNGTVTVDSDGSSFLVTPQFSPNWFDPYFFSLS